MQPVFFKKSDGVKKMNRILKKSLLGAAFLSVTALAGCRGDKPQAKADDKPVHYYTEAEITKSATEIYDKKGMNVLPGTCTLSSNGYTSDYCDFSLEAKVDDGIRYAVRFSAPKNTSSGMTCTLRDDSKVSDALDTAAEKAFNNSARVKFSRLGFAMLDPLQDPDVNYNVFTDGVCGQTTSATFLLKQGGRLYTADYTQDYSYSDHAGTGGRVENITAVGKKPRVEEDETDAAANDDDTPAQARQQRDTPSKSAESKICVGACIGPHIDLQTGKVQLYGSGPGYKLK